LTHTPVNRFAIFCKIFLEDLAHVFNPSREVLKLNRKLDVVNSQLAVPHAEGLAAASHHHVGAANSLNLQQQQQQQQQQWLRRRWLSTCQCAFA
jgi:hypothetical protein